MASLLASIFTMHDIKSYSQWFPGKDNIVADSLSRNDDQTDTELTFILRKFAPHQMPPHFEIAPLPSEIASIIAWLASDEGAYSTGADFSVNGGLHMG